ncbi:MAG: AAA family ATPase [Erysipelotrichaceae bacterium]|nr:AAA family ATPase [Erysipelotrichaceae bacterium]
MKQVIHIFGASGSGTSTLGRALAQRLGLRFMDTDDYYWMKTDPPFTVKREIPERIRMMLKDIEESDGAVCSGSLGGWGDELIPYFTFAIRIEVPTSVRMARLREREYRNFGERIREGGDMFEIHENFIEWASKYDDDDDSVRNRYKHDRWQKKLKCPLIMIDGTKNVEEEIEDVIREMAEISCGDIIK